MSGISFHICLVSINYDLLLIYPTGKFSCFSIAIGLGWPLIQGCTLRENIWSGIYIVLGISSSALLDCCSGLFWSFTAVSSWSLRWFRFVRFSCFITLFRVLVHALIRSVSTTEQIYFWNRLKFLNKHLIFLRSLKEPFRGKSVKISDFRRLIYLRSLSVAGHLVTAYFKFKMLKYHTANALNITNAWWT